jgi:hypothetical protein
VEVVLEQQIEDERLCKESSLIYGQDAFSLRELYADVREYTLASKFSCFEKGRIPSEEAFVKISRLYLACAYSHTIICCDIFTLVLQGAGGGIAASAKTDSMQKIGNDLMMAGIVLQVVILLAFATASADFLLRLHRALRNTRATLSPEAQVLLADTKFQLFAAGLVLAFLTISTRRCYRIAEMAGGWANPSCRMRRISSCWMV